MSATNVRFPHQSPPLETVVVEVIEVIETEGVEILQGTSPAIGGPWKSPANGNALIPYASTLRRVG
jgi:hypothetical protein